MTSVEELAHSPALPEILEQLQKIWLSEQALRRKFYHDITPEHKWEFINGEVIMHSPALNRHLSATRLFYNLLGLYVQMNACGTVQIEKAMCVFPRNDYEPDIVFFGIAKTALLDADTLKFPVPDLVVEVLSPSTEKRDRGVKFIDYAMHGVGEYWIVDAVAETVELYRLQGGQYLPVNPQKNGTLASEVIAGLEIPIRAIFDEAVNLQAVREMLNPGI